jgi:hypothetical protein
MRLVYADDDEDDEKSAEKNAAGEDGGGGSAADHKSVQWQREFFTDHCTFDSHEEKPPPLAAEAFSSLCEEQQKKSESERGRGRRGFSDESSAEPLLSLLQCVHWSVDNLRDASPPSPYTARLLAASAHTRGTAESFIHIDRDICQHPNFLSNNGTLLLSKIFLHADKMLPKEDIYSEGSLHLNLPADTISTAENDAPDASDAPGTDAETGTGESATQSTQNSAPPRVLCVLMTYAPNHLLALAASELWGSQCTGMLAYSNETDWHIPVIQTRCQAAELFGSEADASNLRV